MSEEKQPIDRDPNRPLQLLLGLVLPSQQDHDWAIPIHPEANSHRRLTIRTVRSKMLDGKGRVWPWREAHCEMTPMVLAGTVDELVDKFRELLIAGADQLQELHGKRMQDTEAALQQAQQFGYVPGSQALYTGLFRDAIQGPLYEHRKKQARLQEEMEYWPPRTWEGQDLLLKSGVGETIRVDARIKDNQLLPPNNTGLKLHHVYWLQHPAEPEIYRLLITNEADAEGKVTFLPAELGDKDYP